VGSTRVGEETGHIVRVIPAGVAVVRVGEEELLAGRALQIVAEDLGVDVDKGISM
jgi:hypothetical protein